MMWVHYGGLHSGVCLEFDEDILVENLKKYSALDFHFEIVEYSNRKKSSFIHWQEDKSHDENYKYILRYLLKDMTLLKSDNLEKEDERRLVCMEVDRPIYIPVNNAIKTVYLGVSANQNKDVINSII